MNSIWYNKRLKKRRNNKRRNLIVDRKLNVEFVVLVFLNVTHRCCCTRWQQPYLALCRSLFDTQFRSYMFIFFFYVKNVSTLKSCLSSAATQWTLSETPLFACILYIRPHTRKIKCHRHCTVQSPYKHIQHCHSFLEKYFLDFV